VEATTAVWPAQAVAPPSRSTSSARGPNDDVGAEQLPVLVVYFDNPEDLERLSVPARELLARHPIWARWGEWPEVGTVLVDEAIAERHTRGQNGA